MSREITMRRLPVLLGLGLILFAAATAAAAALTAKISLGFTTQYTGTADLSTPTDAMNIARAIEFTSGTGANQADLVFHDSRTLADGANEVLDLYASGTLLTPLGTALTMTKLKALYVYNTSSDASLLIGGGTTPVGICADATDIVKLPPGGKLILSAPNATGIVTSTNKNLKFEHDGTGSSTLTYEVIIIGID